MDIPLEALTTFPYDGRVIARGQKFLARSASDAKILTLTKKAEYSKPARRGHVETAAVLAEPESVSADVTEPPKRRYRRRDLTAESE